MWIFVVALALLLIGVALIYTLLKSMGESGIEAAAPGSCRSGRCQVNPQGNCASSSPSAVTPENSLVNEIPRKDALSPNQTL